MRPAPITSSTESPTSSATSPPTVRSVRRPGAAARPLSLSDPCTSPPAVRTAGATEKSTPATSDTASVKSTTRASSASVVAPAIPMGRCVASAFTPTHPRTSPSAPPATASTRPSASTCRTMRARPGAHGQAHRHLTGPVAGPHERQVRHVGARQEQKQRDRAEKHHDPGVHVGGQEVAHGHEPGAHDPVRLREVLLEAAHHHLQRSVRLGDRHPGLRAGRSAGANARRRKYTAWRSPGAQPIGVHRSAVGVG